MMAKQNKPCNKQKKTKTKAQILEEAAEVMQLYVRIKAMDFDEMVECVTCGTKRHYKDRMHGGHFVSRSHLATKVLEENIHPQCSKCNGPLKGNPHRYTIYMIEMYGKDFVNELLELKNRVTHYTKIQAEQMLSECRLKLKELKLERGIR